MFFSNKALFIIPLILSRSLMADYSCDVGTRYHINHDDDLLENYVITHIYNMIDILRTQKPEYVIKELELPISLSLNSLNGEDIFFIQLSMKITNSDGRFFFYYSLDDDEKLNIFIKNNDMEYPHFKHCFDKWLSKQLDSHLSQKNHTDL